MDMMSRARGVLYGQCIGDNLGAQVEFYKPEDIAAEYPGGVREMHDGGNTCRRALEGFEKGHASQANGALMRISPLAVAYAGKPGEAERGPRKASQTKSVDNPRQPAELSTDLETPGTRVQFPH